MKLSNSFWGQPLSMLLLVLILLIFSLIFSANGCKLENRIHVSDLVSGSNVMRSDLPGCAEACGDNCAGVSFERATKFCGMFSNLNMNKLYAAEGIQVWVKDCASRNLELPGGFCLIFIHDRYDFHTNVSLQKRNNESILWSSHKITRSVRRLSAFTIEDPHRWHFFPDPIHRPPVPNNGRGDYRKFFASFALKRHLHHSDDTKH